MSAQAEREAGFAALQRGDSASAIASLEKSSQLEPADYLTFLYLGAAYGQTGRNDEAVTALTQAVTLYIMTTNGLFITPLAYVIAGFAAFRAFRRGHG